MKPIAAALGLVLAALAGPALAQSAYDEEWYRADFWSGEYPDGFSVIKDTTVMLRPVLDAAAERSVECGLMAGATYQPWNTSRVAAEALQFVSFTKIATMKVTKALDAVLIREDDSSEASIRFEPGAIWRYLAYYGEGAYLMEYEGVRYTGDQSLMDVSDAFREEDLYEEWLRINCANNRWGWLFMGDVTLDNGTFVAPNITGYGESRDLFERN